LILAIATLRALIFIRDRESVWLTVTDDGFGFEVERALEANGHLGLHGIRERAERVGPPPR